MGSPALSASSRRLLSLPPSLCSDAYYSMRTLFASTPGSLMEFGLGPLITARMLLQLAQGVGLLDCDMSAAEDRRLYGVATKVLTLALTAAQAFAFVLSGMAGDVGAISGLFVVAQLVAASVAVLLLDDLLADSRYGVGGGANLFIIASVSGSFLWRALSLRSVPVGDGATAFEGAVAAFFQALFRPNKLAGFGGALFREAAPSLMSVLASAAVFAAAVWGQGVAVPFRMKWTPEEKARRDRMDPRARDCPPYGLRLLYAVNMPATLLAVLVGNVFFASQALSAALGASSLLARAVGSWVADPSPRPVGGVAYYLAPPAGFGEAVADPFRALFYAVFVVVAFALAAKAWIEITNSGWPAVRASIKAANQEFADRRDVDRIQAHIPTAVPLGAMAAGAIAVAADFIGAAGSGACCVCPSCAAALLSSDGSGRSPPLPLRARQRASLALPSLVTVAPSPALPPPCRHGHPGGGGRHVQPLRPRPRPGGGGDRGRPHQPQVGPAAPDAGRQGRRRRQGRLSPARARQPTSRPGGCPYVAAGILGDGRLPRTHAARCRTADKPKP